jgi:hypothetical protein
MTPSLVRTSEPPDTISRARALLGHDGERLTNAQVRVACDQAALLADIIVQMFLDAQQPARHA